MKTLVLLEVRRALSRRLVRVLIVLALIGIGVVGAVAFREAGRNATTDPFALTSLWPEPVEDALLAPAAAVLALAGLVAGASVIGAEWRAGTMPLLLTWEPRRQRVLTAKAMATFLTAVVVAAALQVLFVAALVPAAALRGTMDGVDLAWTGELTMAGLRIALLTGAASTTGFALAAIGRNTTVALGVAFAQLNLVENLLRGLRPGWSGWLIGENATIFLTNAALRTMPVERSTLGAALVLATYTMGLLAVALALFRQRDVV
ncbi:MAG: hypothetical protein H0U26_09010 [Acidimicrobiia bacterium]|nr:hypothetical protein [Acidimicrobiia bacterium]